MKLQHPHMPVAYGGHVNSHGICVWRSHHMRIHAAAQCAVVAMLGLSPNLARYGCAMQHAIASHMHSCILRLHAPSSCMARDCRGHAATLCSQMSGSTVDVAVLLHDKCCARVWFRDAYGPCVLLLYRNAPATGSMHHSPCPHVRMQPRHLSCIIAAMLLPQSLHCTSPTSTTDIPHHQQRNNDHHACTSAAPTHDRRLTVAIRTRHIAERGPPWTRRAAACVGMQGTRMERVSVCSVIGAHRGWPSVVDVRSHTLHMHEGAKQSTAYTCAHALLFLL